MSAVRQFRQQELGHLRSSFSLSVAIHLLLFMVCAALLSQRATVPLRRTTFIELEPIPQELLNKNRQAKPNQRIVQTTKGEKTDVAAPDAFLGEQTQTLDRQTVSRDKMIQMGESKKTTAKHDFKTKKTAKQMTAKPWALPVQNLGLAILPTAKQMEEIARQSSDGRDNSHFANSGEQSPKDYIQGMKEGEQTALNTREFMFFGYYQRIRERLDRAWVPILRHNLTLLYKRGRTLASETDYSTKVMVVMNTGGEITRVEVETESGAHDLDDAAVRAFNQAGPFPNPPRGMVDLKGEIRIPWEFVLRT